MKKYLLIYLLIVFTCNILSAQKTLIDSLVIKGKPKFDSVDGKLSVDAFSIGFNVLDKNQFRKKSLGDLSKLKLIAKEFIDNNPERPPEFLTGSLIVLENIKSGPVIPEGTTVSILIDKSGSIDTTEMNKIKAAVKSFVEQLDKCRVFFSYFHNDVSSSVPIDSSTFDQANFETTNLNTDLYNAILMKLHEFDKNKVNENVLLESDYHQEPIIAARAEKDSINNYLIVLTDGKNDILGIPKYSNPHYRKISEDSLVKEIEKCKGKVTIYTIGFGESNEDLDEKALNRISKASGNPNGYILGNSDEIKKIFQSYMVKELAIDYQAKFVNPKEKSYQNEKRELRIQLLDEKDVVLAQGNVFYAEGSSLVPIKSGEKEKPVAMIISGLLTGIIILLIVLIILQLIYPLIRNKVFEIRYIKKYKSAKNEVKKICPFCFDEINESDRVVVRCEHIVHKDCWIKCGHMCPEYGQNCNIGKQDYFDIKDPFSTKNKTFYLNWVVYGLIGGLLTWLIYMLLKDYINFNRFSEKLVQWIIPLEVEEKLNYVRKIAPSFTVGVLMGFLLSCFFAYAEEYRRISWPVFGRILLRGIIGAAIGFLAFLVGNLIILIFKEPYKNFFIDCIPWLLFGTLMGYSLSVKTTIYWKHGLLGGLISVFFSFLIWYAMKEDLGLLAAIICFMFYGAGLGFSIATVRSTSEHYFIKILNGSKQGHMIAVHKWMSAQGGLNEVYIGKTSICEIQMNWEKAHDVGDKHAKMYINKVRKMPVLVSLSKGNTTLYDERIEMLVGREYDLLNGVTFKIGETIFQYVEKDS